MRSVGSRVGWATKRARYGETGVSPDVSARLSQAVTERVRRNGHHNSAKTTCKHGHPLTGDNVYTYRAANGRWYRQCRACHRRLMGARPAWVAVDGCRVSISAHDRFYLREYRRLRAAMIAAHPDKGGTAAQFRKAQSRLAAFEEHEMSWYARAGVAVPQRRRRNHAAVLSQGGR